MATYQSSYTGAQIDAAVAAAKTPDTSLSQTGIAADAKATGDAIGNLGSVLDSLKVESYFELSGWRNGYIRSSGSVGTIGSSTNNVVSSYDGSYLTQKGDGKTYSITLDSGWALAQVGEYADHTLSSFVQFVDFGSGIITLAVDKYYVFTLEKTDSSTITGSDVTSTTIVLTHTEYTDDTLSRAGKAADAGAVGELLEEFHGENWLDPTEISQTSGKYCNTSGTIGNSASYAYTLSYIPVSEGDVVYCADDGMITDAKFRYVTAYDSSMNVLSAKGMSTAERTYTVPSGVSFVRCTIFVSDYSRGKLAININKVVPYSAFFSGTVPIQNGNNEERITSLENLPLTSMPSYIAGALKYRPLSALSKGYICLVTDDGKEGLATYTIPMVIDKQVPCTFAVMSASEVFANDTYKALVVDAVNNHGCAIAQHGGRNWTEYSEYGLNHFFDTEKEFFDDLGLSVKSAVVPSHYMSDIVQVVAGGRFGVVRSGYKGYDAAGNFGDTIHNYYDYYTSGEGSNLFGLSSYNFAGRSLAQNKDAIDYAFAYNKILIVYWHENALTNETKAIMEDSIDYAKTKGLEFITLDQIPYLNEGTITF